MSSIKPFSLKNILTVGFISLLLGLLAFSISLWQTPRYKSTIKLLAVFNQTNIDTYTASKTANYITGILGEVIYSDSFVDSVYKGEVTLKDNSGNNPEQKQKEWKKSVKTKILDNKGIINIDVYGNDRYQTNLLASTIGYTIINQHGIYDGSTDRVTIKMIGVPSIFESWSTTKIISDGLIGILAGLLLGFTFVIIFPNHKLFEFNRKKKIYQPINNQAVKSFSTETENKQPITYNAPRTITEEANPARNTNNPWLEKYYEDNLPKNQ